jgi:hypothetical protein
MLRQAVALAMAEEAAAAAATAAAAMDSLSPAEAVASPAEEAMDLLRRREGAPADLPSSSSSRSTAEIGAGKLHRMSALLRNRQVSQIHPSKGNKETRSVLCIHV